MTRKPTLLPSRCTTLTLMEKFTGRSSLAVQPLADALASYERKSSPHYDQVFEQVSERAAADGELGKVDVGALVVWKRLNASTRWSAALMKTDDRQVRTLTHAMIAATRSADSPSNRARGARHALLTLPGCTTGDALASALICAADPYDMAVYDRRAHHALDTLGFPLSNKPGRYSRYIQIVTDLRAAAAEKGLTWSARQVDLALYTLAG